MLPLDIPFLREQIALSGFVTNSQVSDNLLTQKYNSALAEVQRRLDLFLEPTEIIPLDAPQAEIDALELSQTPYYQEAPYDYDPTMFKNGRFGLMTLRKSPVITVHAMQFSFPSPQANIWDVPLSWVKCNKYGQLRLMPQTLGAAFPIAPYIMQMMSGGNNLPWMLRIRYTAGLKGIETNHLDVLELISWMTILNLLKTPGVLLASSSISTDGLSQSQSVNPSIWQSAVDERCKLLHENIHGPGMIVC